jgi:O-methyltransferase
MQYGLRGEAENLPHFLILSFAMLPQRFRPTVSSVLSETIGRVDLEYPASGLASVAYWLHFSRWCRLHPIPRLANGKYGKGRAWLWDSVVQKEGLASLPIQYLEFGVYRGESLSWWLKKLSHPDARFAGFDTFTGLPERWRRSEPLGAFNVNGKLPDMKDARCSFEVGLFQDTLPGFIEHNDLSRRLIIQLDADLYTSTLFVLTRLAPHLKSGDILFFDEFSCPLDEFRAFREFVRSFHVKYEFMGAVYGYTRVCIKIL